MSGYLHSDFPLALLKLQYDVTLEVKPLTQEHPFRPSEEVESAVSDNNIPKSLQIKSYMAGGHCVKEAFC